MNILIGNELPKKQIDFLFRGYLKLFSIILDGGQTILVKPNIV
jgi:hypothetical protein